MEKRERLFVYSFVYTLGILIFFLGSSITGKVVQTSYCDGLNCYDYCKTNSDCSLNEVCCQEQNFGICKTNCEQEFVFTPELDVQYPFPELEQPLKKLFAASHQENTKLEIMTIHKAKGLEFDAVIIPGLNKSTKTQDPQLLLWKKLPKNPPKRGNRC